MSNRTSQEISPLESCIVSLTDDGRNDDPHDDPDG